MMAIFLKYRSINLIIFYYCTYSGLLGTMEVIIQNSIWGIKSLVLRLMNDWNGVWSMPEKGGKDMNVG